MVRLSVKHGCGGRVYFILPQSQGAGWWDIDWSAYAFAMAMGEDAKVGPNTTLLTVLGTVSVRYLSM